MDEHGNIGDIDFTGQIDKISVEDEVMKVTISMDSTFLDPIQMADLVSVCGFPKTVDVLISEHPKGI